MALNFKFNGFYFLLTLILFIAEVIIAIYLKDVVWIRSYFGDVVVVWLVYTLVLSFIEVENKSRLVLGVLLFAFVVEIAQYFSLSDRLGFERGSVASIVLGNSFSWLDMGCYLLGASVLWTILFFKSMYGES